MSRGAKLLKDYLDELDYKKMYRYLCGLNQYHQTPLCINSNRTYPNNYIEALVGDQTYPLLDFFLFLKEVDYNQLSVTEKQVVDALEEENIISIENGILMTQGYQIICYDDFYIMIDGYINHGEKGVHRSYIGLDTYLMLYYITMKKGGSYKGLDLCTGSGIGALFLSKYCDEVIATDIAEFPLKLAAFNFALNDKEDKITLREESYLDTLNREEKYDLVTCNPPFVCFPAGINAPIFAKGDEVDGLSFYRQFLEKADHVLTHNGKAYFVGNFAGDNYTPYFYKELEGFVNQNKLNIDMVVDLKFDGEEQKRLYPYMFKVFNPEINLEELKEMSQVLVDEQLKAKYYYLLTLVIENKQTPNLRYFTRYKRCPDFDQLFM